MRKHKLHLNRRDFLATAAKAGAILALPQFVPSRVLGREGNVPPSEQIVLGGIGIGNRGTYDLGCFLEEPDVRFVAVCDVKAERRRAVKKKADDKYGNQDCATYRDLRELLARPDIDAVLIATGPNWHATAAALAANAGKDIYCEKPCTKNIAQSLALAEIIRRTGRVFQAGTQRRSLPNFVFAIDLARRGKLGPLKTHVCPSDGAGDQDQRLDARRTRARQRASGLGYSISDPLRGAPSTARCWMDLISKKAAGWSAAAASNGDPIASTFASGPTMRTTRRRWNTNPREPNCMPATPTALIWFCATTAGFHWAPARFVLKEIPVGSKQGMTPKSSPALRHCWRAAAPKSRAIPPTSTSGIFWIASRRAPRPARTRIPRVMLTSPVTRPISLCSWGAKFSTTR